MEGANKDIRELKKREIGMPEFNIQSISIAPEKIHEFFDKITDKYIDVRCGDGTQVRVLKDPLKAFEIYNKEYKVNAQAVMDTLNKLQAGVQAGLSEKIKMFFDNLDDVEFKLREMYKNAYLTFVTNPCDKRFQDYKFRADNIIMVVSLYMGICKLMLIKLIGKDPNAIKDELDKIIDKVLEISYNIINKILEKEIQQS
jgi:hypothetical protein